VRSKGRMMSLNGTSEEGQATMPQVVDPWSRVMPGEKYLLSYLHVIP
jgi:hypothetical protein